MQGLILVVREPDFSSGNIALKLLDARHAWDSGDDRVPDDPGECDLRGTCVVCFSHLVQGFD